LRDSCAKSCACGPCRRLARRIGNELENAEKMSGVLCGEFFWDLGERLA
jgi:hypothetical protein